MAYRQYDYDPNPNSDQATIPQGYDFWRPDWKVAEDGTLIKSTSQDEMLKKTEDLAESAYFQCNQCDFKTAHEPSIKTHVTRMHKKEVQ